MPIYSGSDEFALAAPVDRVRAALLNLSQREIDLALAVGGILGEPEGRRGIKRLQRGGSDAFFMAPAYADWYKTLEGVVTPRGRWIEINLSDDGGATLVQVRSVHSTSASGLGPGYAIADPDVLGQGHRSIAQRAAQALRPLLETKLDLASREAAL